MGNQTGQFFFLWNGQVVCLSFELIVIDHDVPQIVIAIGSRFIERERHGIRGGRITKVLLMQLLGLGVVGNGEAGMNFHHLAYCTGKIQALPEQCLWSDLDAPNVQRFTHNRLRFGLGGTFGPRLGTEEELDSREQLKFL